MNKPDTLELQHEIDNIKFNASIQENTVFCGFAFVLGLVALAIALAAL